MQYNEMLSLISAKEQAGMRLGLERINKALVSLGSPQDKIKTIHVAGTNGKGSVASSIANSLSAAGFRAGLFTSPWVVDYREQIQINGAFIKKDRLVSLTEKLNAAFPQLTAFEMLTVAAFQYFYKENVDYAVIECGMGGTLDATNVITHPLVSVITEISLDHIDVLGSTLQEIAQHKAGIIKQNSTAVLYPNEKTQSIFELKCKAMHTYLINVPDRGDFRLNNRETVRLCLRAAGLSIPVAAPSLPARLERVGPNILVDGSHNLSAAQALLCYLNENKITGVTAVLSMMKDKNVAGYLKIIAPYCKEIYTCRVSNERAMPAGELASLAKKYCQNVTPCSSPQQALEKAMAAGGFLLVCGSFYLARDIRGLLL